MEKKQCVLEILTVSTTVFLTGRGHGPHVFHHFSSTGVLVSTIIYFVSLVFLPYVIVISFFVVFIQFLRIRLRFSVY